MSKKVIIIGLDGATLDLIKSGVEEGKLPTFRKLMTEGVYGILRSTTPAITLPAVPSFMTGKNPGKHGISGFVDPSRDRALGLVNSEKISGEFYTVSGMEWKKKLLINLPMTYPAKEINGYTISCLLTPNKMSKGFLYPPSLREEINHLLKEYVIDDRSISVPGKEKEIISRTKRMTDSRLQVAEYMLSHKEWDLAIVYFVILDRVQHRMFGKDANALVFEAYSKVDNCLAKLIDTVGSETDVVVFSDHGFGPSKGRFYVNAWLQKSGFLFYRASARRPIGQEYFQRFRSLLKEVSLLTRFIPQSLINYLGNLLTTPERVYGTQNIDWSKTKAFATVSGIYINAEQSSAEYQRIKENITNRLKDLKEPQSGKNLEVKVFTKEELYNGPHLGECPDLIYSIEDYAYEPHPSTEDVSYLHSYRIPRGWHREEGIFMAYGPSINRGREINEIRIYDIAPTILHLMGVSVPRDMDGRVLKDIFRGRSEVAHREIAYQETWQGKERIIDRITYLRKTGKL